MSNEFELPTEGIKIYSPQKGWQDQRQAVDSAPPSPSYFVEPEPELEPDQIPAPDTPSRDLPVQLAHDQAAALAQVGGSLHALFEALQQPLTPSNVIDAGPSWRDVADLSRFMEDRLAQREELLAQLKGLEDDIRRARGGLLEALDLLAAQEQRNLEAAQVRADVSAMAAKVIAKRFSDGEALAPPQS
jgi:hypothetical protein